MDFGANKAPMEVIKKGTFGGTYFRDIYSSVNCKGGLTLETFILVLMVSGTEI